MNICPYKIGDKVLFQGKEYEISNILPDWFRGFDLYLKGRGWEYINLVATINKGEQMTNKQEAKQQLEKLEAEVQKLKEIINKPEKAGSLLEDGDYYISSYQGRLEAFVLHFDTPNLNRFPSKEIAQSYAEAFNTMLALRKCEGSVSTVNGKEQWFVRLALSLKDTETYAYPGNYSKIVTLSPSFSTKGYAQAAIDKVGKDNIIKMFKTLHGIYD